MHSAHKTVQLTDALKKPHKAHTTPFICIKLWDLHYLNSSEKPLFPRTVETLTKRDGVLQLGYID